MVVVDASAALAWLLRSQSTAAAFAFLGAIADHDLVTPFVFDWEVRNILLTRTIRARLPAGAYFSAVGELDEYDITRGEPFDAEAVVAVAMHERLNLFDAAYLAMALDQGAALASRDAELLAAAARHGLPTFDLR